MIKKENSSNRRQLFFQSSFFLVWGLVNLYLYLNLNETKLAGNFGPEISLHFENLYELIKLIWPLGFLPILSIRAYLGLPSVALLLVNPDFVPQKGYYLNALIVFSFIALIFFLKKRLSNGKSITSWLIFILTLSFASNFGENLIGEYKNVPDQPYKIITDQRFFPVKNIFNSQFYLPSLKVSRVLEVASKILPSESVSATGDLLPYIPPRTTLFEVFDPSVPYLNVDYIFLTKKYCGLGAGNYYWSPEGIDPLILRLKQQNEFRVAFENDEIIVFAKQ